MNAATRQSLAEQPVSFGARPAVRRAKDVALGWIIAAGGMGVIVAISLIFFYLLWVVLPLFAGASMEARPLAAADTARTRFLSMDDVGDVGIRLLDDGTAQTLDLATGEISGELPIPYAGTVTRVAVVDPIAGALALALADGRVLLIELDYEVSYSAAGRVAVPEVGLPLGPEPLVLSDAVLNYRALAVRSDESSATVAAISEAGELLVRRFQSRRNFLTGASSLQAGTLETVPLTGVLGAPASFLLIDPAQRWLYLANADGDLAMYALSRNGPPELLQRTDLTRGGAQLTTLDLLLGGYSLLAGDDQGRITQWFPVRGEDGTFSLRNVRSFELGAAVVSVRSEHRRKGFVAAGADGSIGLFYTTSARELLRTDGGAAAVSAMAISPRGKVLLVERSDGTQERYAVDNEHPEVSWSALWEEVWYESFDEPDYIWQSSASHSEFEPKFSLMPLAFGTLKAAFYAMLFAVPLAIFGAMYTAYFMTPRMRQFVKPTIEIMGALPTVIIGFLAGLWLAPVLEENLAGVLIILFGLPLAVPAFGYLWDSVPGQLRDFVPDGWSAALLVPVIVLVGWAGIALGAPLEQAFFGGDLPHWLTVEAGVDFDQRNAMVVGLAMGFAVIPTIFSIAEDALFGVPRHLSNGSLALGATPWQTLLGVVLPTASPGIFSAVMIGLGRAVGETMIVLMATGNTPIMDVNIFEGMRTLSANIAVEMPESEVGSSHYRILFLAGLVLFIITFVFNTGAELIRQRLRRKYANL